MTDMTTGTVINSLLILGLFFLGGKLMADFTNLETKVDAIATVIPNLQADYAALKQEIEDLKQNADPAVQAKIDALTAKIDTSLASLTALDESVPGATQA